MSRYESSGDLGGGHFYLRPSACHSPSIRRAYLRISQQVANAIEIAWNPSSDPNLKSQAYDFLNQLRTDPSGWQVCLTIFTHSPRYTEVVRHVALEVVNNAIQTGLIDPQGLVYLKDNLLQYIRQLYGPQESGETDSANLQNKITQIVTSLFAGLYGSGWESFFSDFSALTQGEDGSARGNRKGVMMYLRLLNSIHDEIGDVLLSRSGDEQKKANDLKDLIRQRDVQNIAYSWQEILSRWREQDDGISEACLKAIGSWVSWIDISLIVNQDMLDLLFQQLGRAQRTDIEGEDRVRDVAIDVFSEIVAKKMKPADKLNMMEFLNLDGIVARLIQSPPLNERRFSSTYDTDLAETVAKLVNITVADIVRALDGELADGDSRSQADELLEAFLPHLLRFFSDEYDEICSTVIPSLNDLLAFFRKEAKEMGSLPGPYDETLLPILKAVIAKMRYDETSSWGDEDEQTDEAEFQDLRKRLQTLQQNIAVIDERLFIATISKMVGTTFQNLRQQGSQLDWRDLDLAMYEMYLFGDLAVKHGGLYNKNNPNSTAAERLVQMMLKMVESGTV